MSYQWIKASEIGEYVFCRRSWWLRRVRGKPSAQLAALRDGAEYHQRHGRLVERSAWARRLAYWALFSAIAVLVFELFTG